MKKIKSLLLIILALVMIASIAVIAVACDKNDETPSEPVVNIPKVKVKLGEVEANSVTYDGSAFVWAEVRHADAYEVTYNGTTKNVTEARFQPDVAVSDDVNFGVRAIADTDNDSYVSCPKVTSVSFTYVAPVKIGVEGRSFVWNEITGAVGYIVVANDSPMQGYQSSTRFDMIKSAEIGTSSAKIQVRPVFSDPTTITNWATAVATMLGEPQNLYYDGQALKWDAVEGAAGYNVTVKKALPNGTVVTVKDTVFSDKTEYIYNSTGDNQGTGDETKDIIFEVSAAGSNRNETEQLKNLIFDSNPVKIAFTYVDPVSGIKVEKGVLKWTSALSAEGYLLQLRYIVDGKEVKEEIVLNCNAYEGLNPGIQYSVKVLPRNESNTIFSSWSEEAIVSVLEQPVLTWEAGNEGSGTVKWIKDNNASNYKVFVHFVQLSGERTLVKGERYTGGDPFVQINDQEDLPYPGLFEVTVLASEIEGTSNCESKLSDPILFYKLPQSSAYYETQLGQTDEGDGVLRISFNYPELNLTYRNKFGGLAFIPDDFGIRYRLNSPVMGWNNVVVTTSEYSAPYYEDIIAGNGGKFSVTIDIQTEYNLQLKSKVFEEGEETQTINYVVLNSNKEYSVEFVMLDSPAKVEVNSSILSWERVQGATGYRIRTTNLKTGDIKDAAVVYGTVFDLNTVDIDYFDVRVSALGNNSLYLTSQFSNPFTCIHLGLPKNLSVSPENEITQDGTFRTITWDCDPVLDNGGREFYPTSYTVVVGSSTVTAADRHYQINVDEVTTFGLPVTIYAVEGADEQYKDIYKLPSRASNTESVTLVLYRLIEPRGTTLTDEYFSWLPITSKDNNQNNICKGYYVFNGNTPVNLELIPNDDTKENVIYFRDYPGIFGTGNRVDLNLTVVAVGEGAYFNSLNSVSVNAVRLEAPVVSISPYDGTVSWSAVPNALGYAVKVEYEKYPEHDRTYEFGPNTFTCKPVYELMQEEVDSVATITVIALGDNGFNYINSVSKGVCTATLEKLSTLTNVEEGVKVSVNDNSREIVVTIDESKTHTKGKGYGILIDNAETVVRRYIAEENLYISNGDGTYSYPLSRGNVVYKDGIYTYTYATSTSGTFTVGVRASGGNYNADPTKTTKDIIAYIDSDVTNLVEHVETRADGTKETVNGLVLLGAFSDSLTDISLDVRDGYAIVLRNLPNACGYTYTISFAGAGGTPLDIEAVSGLYTLEQEDIGKERIIIAFDSSLVTDEVFQIVVAVRVMGNAENNVFDSAETRVVTLLVPQK